MSLNNYIYIGAFIEISDNTSKEMLSDIDDFLCERFDESLTHATPRVYIPNRKKYGLKFDKNSSNVYSKLCPMYTAKTFSLFENDFSKELEYLSNIVDIQTYYGYVVSSHS